MDINLGRTLGKLKVNVIYGSDQSFGLQFWQDTALTVPAVLTGSTVAITIDPDGDAPIVWAATVSEQTATWTLTAAQTSLDWNRRPARLALDDYVIAAGTIEVQR